MYFLVLVLLFNPNNNQIEGFPTGVARESLIKSNYFKQDKTVA